MTESSSASPSPELPIDLTHAQTQLALGEEILWSCRCDAKRMALRGKLAILLGMPMLLGMTLLVLITLIPREENWAEPVTWLMKILSLSLLVALAFCIRYLLRMPERNREGFGKAIHVLTNRRIFISTPSVRPTWAFQLHKLDDVYSRENTDGTGDIIFAYPITESTSRSGFFTLYGIPNAKVAEKQIADAIANAKTSDANQS